MRRAQLGMEYFRSLVVFRYATRKAPVWVVAMFAHVFKKLHPFGSAAPARAAVEELWLGAVGVLVVAWLVIALTAPGKRSDAGPRCDFHGRAALVCGGESAEPSAEPANPHCASYGRAGRLCFDRP
jgi:hypothetical protein